MSRESLDIQRHNELITKINELISLQGGTPTVSDAPKEYFGLASETKPVDDVTKGSTFFVIDTGEVHMFDGTIWRLI